MQGQTKMVREFLQTEENEKIMNFSYQKKAKADNLMP